MRRLAATLAVLGACAPTDHSVGLFGTGAPTTGVPDATSTGATTTATPTSGTAPDTTAGGQRFDVGAGEGTPGTEYCGMVDILFVIDNSPSMGSYQEQLAFAFPTFIDAMWNNLPAGTDLHVGITTTSFFSGSCAESTMNCASAQTEAEILAHYLTPDQGSTGVDGEQGRLFEHDGKRFFAATVGDDPWPLKIWFAEAAVDAGEVGCSYEMMSAGASYPFHPANAADNAGFVRDDDAVLVIVVLTDEPDKSPEDLAVYVDLVTAAKAGCGGADCVVAAGLVDGCIMGTDDRLWAFLNAWPDPPQLGDIFDAAGYDDVVGAALAAAIGTKCDEIRPEG